MDKKVQRCIDSPPAPKAVGWEMLLERAELALYKNRAARARINAAIHFFQEQIKTGAPWPLEPPPGKAFPSQDSETHPDSLEKNASGDYVRQAKP